MLRTEERKENKRTISINKNYDQQKNNKDEKLGKAKKF